MSAPYDLARPIAISCGEPAGVGPELMEAAWQATRAQLPLLWVGDPRHLPATLPHRIVADPQEALDICPKALPVLPLAFEGSAARGVADPANAAGVIDAIACAVDLVQRGAASALCTLPIHKKALKDGADFAYPGHTEYLAALAGVSRVVMMLACDALRVVPATIHIPLSAVPAAFTPAVLEETVRITQSALRTQWGLAHPRIAIAGLNPHAGEGGAMGTQEQDWMFASCAKLRAEGIEVTDPLPPDTMFHSRARAAYDVAVCAYHDQALIPIKTLDFDRGVNVTLGLPFIRTSPDHGTAFDIAGKGIARPDSVIAALNMAARMARAAQS
ncbi:4-hydroxythreonine-4-phosphate dehydrogenase 1 [Aquimixticola soesokkakensis]|uniref:4-hydroxythreonine-4-phosphate dehydrogenase n=1 Tax=Aquimixticola soesokkakensis TaxID=1519096 RepID=A0A1Y5TIU0_9RHOB|nr:4-hydroxythreonine-4-phosphate dehydrogenase PdxA [Aquimixticola soesokkakensis]SLN64962.1 4-hydroxythreonine-4-phosphate dehydrogenase 1 [Aquimixticola soesokkakensis]